jgi:hypothetical protein
MAHVIQLDRQHFANRSASLAVSEDSAPQELQWRTSESLTLDQASELLDWLENHSITQRECQLMENGSFLVRWFG